MAETSTVYAIFEGGGAKGITHVGALKALEEARLAVVGVAGTSAGAIIAALVAVGYKADEILAPDGSGVLKTLGTDVLGVLGKGDWRRFRLLRWLGPKLALAGVVALATLVSGFFLAALFDLSGRAALQAWSPWLARGARWAGVVLGACIALLVILVWTPARRRGLFRSDRLRKTVNDALRSKLAQLYDANGIERPLPERIRFGDMDPQVVPDCVPLKVVVSDVRSGRLVLFDRDQPCVSVADAVVASASIPFAFAPPLVEGARSDGAPVYVDGGLVSNLPSWVFAMEKREFERRQGGARVPIFAFALRERKRVRSWLARWFRVIGFTQDVLATGIFGSQQVVADFVTDLERIELPTPLDTLSFGLSAKDAQAAREAGRVAAGEALRRRRRTELLIERLLGTIHNMAAAALKSSTPGATPRLRLSLIDPNGPPTRPEAEFRIVASFGMDKDCDDRMLLDTGHPGAPLAYARRRPVYVPLAGKDAGELRMTKYDQALLPRDRNSAICIPVFGRRLEPDKVAPPAARVLCLDSSEDLQPAFDDPSFMAMLAGGSEPLSPVIIKETVK